MTQMHWVNIKTCTPWEIFLDMSCFEYVDDDLICLGMSLQDLSLSLSLFWACGTCLSSLSMTELEIENGDAKIGGNI